MSQADLDQLITRFEEVLDDRVTEVRASKLLTDSPCRLVPSESGPERDLQRLRRLLGEDDEVPAMIMEVNRQHPLIQRLTTMVADGSEDSLIDATVEQLFDNLLLLEGLHPNPAQMVPRIQTFLEAAI